MGTGETASARSVITSRPWTRLEFPRPGPSLDNPLARWQTAHVPYTKLEELRRLLRSFGSCVTAYSGGVDSAFLALVAHQELGARALAVIADSPSLPRSELAEAVELATRFGFALRVVTTREFDNPAYLANPQNRCYFCKHSLFEELAPLAQREGFAVLAYGENASDLGDHRPGARAAAEFQVRAPLRDTGMTKAEIRTLSALLGLPTADKPQLACLSSRIPYGEEVTREKLAMIESAEACLRAQGFVDVRVRHHEIRGGALARLEIGTAELPRILTEGRQALVAQRLREIGYSQVTLDLLGYRRGSANETPLPTRTLPAHVTQHAPLPA
ncbi:MAG: ATP-dependent sacrificial sulfur transferase LarE [Verrucomicrobiales bacterium]|nr:ATP-dependent sacrificial sulfur transferase LarE [Verrucomicrobiales bacterium]